MRKNVYRQTNSNIEKQDQKNYYIYIYIFKLGFTPCRTEQPLQGMELQEKEAKKIKACRKST